MLTLKERQQEIKRLEGLFCGDILADMELADKIHEHKMAINGVQPNCSMDEGCDSCGA